MSGASKQNNGTALASTTEVDEKLNVKRKKKKKTAPNSLSCLSSGVQILSFQKQFEISGLPETWIFGCFLRFENKFPAAWECCNTVGYEAPDYKDQNFPF